ncbi:serine hydrolase domain-containing protein [Scleromatobacter humisilvae]|uniref:Beta-lactamase family protein n=1 Tax=Scleromatobacter humisilvae TaxID=2897159 RepID=A0A9X1YNZ1_9BURK|nr:serine hydrolase domain-containing protein [Scleromatobacter humisilvae]MCK9689322.1 beta-lactamase family protein [Scleromatobacter humisilvae]
MNRISLLLCACLALLAGAASAQDTAAADALDNAMRGTAVPAMAVLEMRDGQVAREAVRGVRRNDGTEPARLDDAWLIGSDAKPMTAALVAKLIDRKLLSWTTPLSEMLPTLASRMRPEYRGVTLEQLLSHHAGLPHDASDEAFFNAFFHDTRPLPEQRLDYIGKALAEAPVAAPGTKFEYSNTGFLVAAVIAERVAGKPYEALVRQEVFEPLGMHGVEFGAMHANQPQGHHDGKPAQLADTNPDMFAPAGNMAMPLRDWAAFCLDQMAGGEGHGRLLSAASYREMQTVQPGGGSAGLGWGIQASLGGHAGPVWMHAGSDGTGYAIVALFPASKRGLLVVANAGDEMGGAKAARDAMVALMKSYP